MKTIHRMGTLFANLRSKRDLYPEYINKFSKVNNEKTNNPTVKWAKDLNRHFSKEMYKWPTNAWKGGQD